MPLKLDIFSRCVQICKAAAQITKPKIFYCVSHFILKIDVRKSLVK